MCLEVRKTLTGQAKTDYQRDYMRRRRASPSLDPVRPCKPKILELQAIIHSIENKKPVQNVFDSSIPWYNPEVHTTGDKVKQFRNGIVEVVTL